ncbi:MAG TPA: diaminopimelate decarboxylase [Gemmatimonadales bacterium]|nr:diaminopimelate decarboxylase [Gemmatimonadales bacterium]
MSRDGEGRLSMADVQLEDIAAAIGTPTYVYNAAVIRDRYRLLDEALAGLPHRICYAVKANGNLAVLRVLAELGAGADIVSGGELLRALAAGFPADRIVFSGVGKTDEELQAAIAAGVGHINVESVSELTRLATLAGMQGARVRIGVRINPDVTVETHPYISTGQGGLKFGIPVDQLDELFTILDDSDGVELDAIAMHLGSQLLSPQPWVDGVEQLLAVLDLAASRGHQVGVLDLGGGFGIRYRDETPLDPAVLVDAIRHRLAGTGCEIRVEPGRFLVGSAGVLLSRVVHRKRSGGREIAIVDAGMNDLLRPALYKAWHEIVPALDDGAEAIPTDIVGPVCETGDFLALARPFAPVPAGGLIAVLGAGAYAFAMSSNYNARGRAAEVLVDGDRWALVRPRERLSDLYRDETSDPFSSERQ